jgi:uncharacterized OB-fold protein
LNRDGMNLLKPTLYSIAPAPDGGTAIVLQGRECRCGHVFFPPQDFGCERCGRTGTDVVPRPLPARAKLLSWATVHIHPRSYPRSPFVVGKIQLESGPVFRALVRVASEAGLRAGLALKAALVPVGDAQEHMDLWFVPEEEATSV